MTKIIVAFALLPMLGGCAAYDAAQAVRAEAQAWRSEMRNSLGLPSAGPAGPSAFDANPTYMTPNHGMVSIRPNAYGLGVSSDQYGRPVQTNPLWRGERQGIFAPCSIQNPVGC